MYSNNPVIDCDVQEMIERASDPRTVIPDHVRLEARQARQRDPANGAGLHSCHGIAAKAADRKIIDRNLETG